MSPELDRLTDRVSSALAKQLRGMVAVDIATLAKVCESPIELMLGAAVLSFDRMDGGMSNDFRLVDDGRPESWWADDQPLLIPQYEWNGYRIDFALRMSSHHRYRRIFVECDGHEFHERTKKQAARDRQKDRFAQTDGIPILRFTGSEIFENPVACVVQINEFLIQQVEASIV